ncbi:hypothetical protein C7Y71_002200 [Pseudoprevotella muciniphila]|uniref:Fibrobacter succinogenes major paralogous domain-containing protein n=2 Tax=Pseudoprevotella muciniphila TaxID=2133944 RepID=A0A5P8E4P0_9BACT|nr:hypothetical protein C7Y71_002200 [Pseudoprevotella muciniphila]
MVAITTSFLPLTLSAQNGMDHGHRYIDLGLPSGTKWADCNIGAKTRTNYGYYYAWGETSRKTKYDWDSYKFGSDKLTKYCTDSDYGEDGFTDDKEELDLSDDVARKLWGGKWRIPSDEQFEELIEHTKHRWTKINGVKGMLFTGRNGHSIFLPAAGHRYGTSLYDAGSGANYWSRTLNADSPDYAYCLYFYSDGVYVTHLPQLRTHCTARAF